MTMFRDPEFIEVYCFLIKFAMKMNEKMALELNSYVEHKQWHTLNIYKTLI